MAESVILVVDDEKVVLDTLTQELDHHFGAAVSVETAESVEESWELLEKLVAEGAQVLVVVSDWLMPGTKGDQFLADLRVRFPNIGRILLTGQADPAALERARTAASVHRVIFKPWRADELHAAIVAAGGIR